MAENFDTDVETYENKMQASINRLEDSAETGTMLEDLHRFQKLYTRFLQNQPSLLDWKDVQPVQDSQMAQYDSMPVLDDNKVAALLSKVAIIKLNGGLATTMGCTGPKSLVEVRGDKTFLDLVVDQTETLNQKYKVDVPLLLMTSFNTSEATKKTLSRYKEREVNIRIFEQSKMPRIHAETLLPLADSCNSPKEYWYPPGHADLLFALHRSGSLADLIAEGKEYIFVSNIDNLGATADMRILSHMATAQKSFLMEMTEKTRADVKGGTLINYQGQVSLLEVAQVPRDKLREFYTSPRFRVFNTNNLWISLQAINELFQHGEPELDIIVNRKTLENKKPVIQLETAIGSAIRRFPSAEGMVVPRTRFLPVKDCNDLFYMQSNLYSVRNGFLFPNPKRRFSDLPTIKLCNALKKMSEYQKHIPSVPDLLELDHLTVSGDVFFGQNMRLSGTVIIAADRGQRIDLPDNSCLCDKVLTGGLTLVDI